VLGNAAHLAGLNVVGLRRRGFSREVIRDLRAAYRLLFAQEGTFAERLEDTSTAYGEHELVTEIVDFIRGQENRSICMPQTGR
jgi:UDP-N-acetylglucosamine acyltransferase